MKVIIASIIPRNHSFSSQNEKMICDGGLSVVLMMKMEKMGKGGETKNVIVERHVEATHD